MVVKTYLKTLVNIHKLILGVILLSPWNLSQAQVVLTLDQCIDTAQIYNKNLQIKRNSIAFNQEREKEAKANLIPKISVGADYKYFMELPTQLMPMNVFNPQVPEGQFNRVQFGVPHNINANIQLAMPLYNPQVYGAIQNTQIGKELSELQYQKAEEQVIYDITSMYYNAQIIKHQLRFIDSNLINTDKLLRSMQLLHQQLLVKGTDVNKVKLQADQLTTQREIVQDKYDQVLNALKLNMGISLDAAIEVEDKISMQVPQNYSRLFNTDVQILKTQNKLLSSELKTLNRSRYAPSLNFIASYGTTGFGYDKSPHEFLDFYSVGFAGIQLSYPIFNGTVTQRRINQKTWEIKSNELQAQLIDDKVKMEIGNATRQKATALSAVTNTEKQHQQAQTIYEQTVLQQKQGTASLTDVLLADNAVRESQQNYLSAIIDFLKADLDLKRITGNINHQ